jgi:hypothetical protein
VTIKVTLFMGAEGYSWSESHYYLGTNDFGSTNGPAVSLAQLRNATLGQYANVLAARMSYVPANRQVFEVDLSQLFGSSQLFTAIPGGDNSDQPFTALMMNLQNLASNKNLYLAGIPDGVVVINPNFPNGFEPGGDFANELKGYMNFLTGQGVSTPAWGFRSRIKLPGTMVNAVASQPGYNNNIGVSTAVDPGIAAGSEANLTGFKRINTRVPSLAGAYEVIAVIPPGSGNPNWITVLGETGNVQEDNFFKLGVIAPLTFQYLPYQSWHVVRVTHRKRGGSFGLPRGRSRARR